MEVATTTAEATLSAIHESLEQLYVKLGRNAARQETMLADLKKTTAALAPTAATTPAFMLGRVPEQQATKPSSPSIISAHRVVATAALQTGTVLTSFAPKVFEEIPTKTSAAAVVTKAASAPTALLLQKGHGHYIDKGRVELVFPGSDIAHLPDTTSFGARNCTLQGVVWAGMNTPAGCSTHVRTWLREVPNEVYKEKDTLVQEELDDALTHVGGSSLFLELGMDTTDQVLDAQLLKDELRSDAILTQVAAVHTQCYNQQCKVPLFLVGFGTGAGGTLYHGSESVMICDAQKGGHAIDIQMKSTDYSASSFYVAIKIMLKLNSFAQLWDPGIVKIISWSCQHGTVSTQPVLTLSHGYVAVVGSAGGIVNNIDQYWSGIALFWTPYSAVQHFLCLVQMRCLIFLNKLPLGKRGFASLYLMASTLKKAVLADALRQSLVNCDIDPCKIIDMFSGGLALYKCIFSVAKVAVYILLNLTFGEVVCMIQTSFSLAVSPLDMFQEINMGSVCMVVGEFKAHKQHIFVEVQMICRSAHIFLVEFSLVDESSAATASNDLFQCVNWQYHIGQRHSLIPEGMVHRNQQDAGSGYYFHPQSRLFGFTISQLCNMSTPDGMPWDPGGINGSGIRAIAWGQAMFCRGGNVTPHITVGLCWSYGLLYLGLGRRISLGAGWIKAEECSTRRGSNRTESGCSRPLSSVSYLCLSL